jgi:hypothetical protein
MIQGRLSGNGHAPMASCGRIFPPKAISKKVCFLKWLFFSGYETIHHQFFIFLSVKGFWGNRRM